MDSSYNQLWESASNFLQNGFGFCILKDGEFVSICNTYYVKQGFAEIVVTKKDYRSQGFATVVCSAFIKFCVKYDIVPLWVPESPFYHYFFEDFQKRRIHYDFS